MSTLRDRMRSPWTQQDAVIKRGLAVEEKEFGAVKASPQCRRVPPCAGHSLVSPRYSSLSNRASNLRVGVLGHRAETQPELPICPRDAGYYDVSLGAGKEPNPSDLERAGEDTILIETRLS